MRKEAVNAAFFFLVLVVLLVLAFIILLPILDFMLFGFLLAIGFWPVRQGVRRVVPSDGWAAFTTLVIAAVVVIVPLVVIVLSLLDDVRNFASYVEPGNLHGTVVSAFHLQPDGRGAAIAEVVVPHVEGFVDSLTHDLAGVVARLAIGLMVVVFVLFYAFAQGPLMVDRLKAFLPLKAVYKDRLIGETQTAVNAIFFGQITVSVVHGVVLGLGFWIFGLPNPVVWGFVAMVVSILPAVGTPAVWLPAGLYVFFAVGQAEGIALMVWGAILSTVVVEYWWRLRVIRARGHIHPLVVIVGVVGGIGVFGLSGFIFGPLILALLMVFTRVFSESYTEDPNYLFL